MAKTFYSIFQGSTFSDGRGDISFINEFDMSPIKRQYIIKPASTDIVRAWQGHRKEGKWFISLEGSFKVGLVKPENWENISKELEVEYIQLDANTNKVLYIPPGCFNGFKALVPESKLLVYSDFTTAESAADDFRLESNYWDL